MRIAGKRAPTAFPLVRKLWLGNGLMGIEAGAWEQGGSPCTKKRTLNRRKGEGYSRQPLSGSRPLCAGGIGARSAQASCSPQPERGEKG
jgi:hypothetical protein